MQDGNVILKGAGGQRYRFALATPQARFNAVGAVYAFIAWPVRSGPFFVAHVGHSADCTGGFADNPLWQAAQAGFGATLIAGLVLENAAARERVARDLIHAYAPPLNMAGDVLVAGTPGLQKPL